VGIGTTPTPSAKLHIRKSDAGFDDDDLSSEDVIIEDAGNAWLGLYSDNVGAVVSGITFAEKNPNSADAPTKWAIFARTESNVGDLVFTHGDNTNPGANDVMMRIEKDATVVIGGGNTPTAPWGKLELVDNNVVAVSLDGSSDHPDIGVLHGNAQAYMTADGGGGRLFLRNSMGEICIDLDAVDGNAKVASLEISGGCDLSEKFNVNSGDAAIDPGYVVSIDPQHPGELRVSSAAYDRTVAGIISGANGVNTGMIMGQSGSVADGNQPVALTGRVWTWCNASNGSIQPGDLLTTSDFPGQAMKVLDYPRAQGAIIGKAMTPLSEGNGLVLVLVSLQ